MTKKTKLSASTGRTKFSGRRAKRAALSATPPLSRRQRRAALLASTGFRSGYEQKIAVDLSKREIEYKYEKDCFNYPFPIRGSKCIKCGSPATRISHYTPDFKFGNGSYAEVKGRFTAGNRTRLIAFKAAHPEITLYILFQRDNYITKSHKKTYSQWAKQYGFECAVGETIPTHWTWTRK